MSLIIAGSLPATISAQDQELKKRAPLARSVGLKTKPMRTSLVHDGEKDAKRNGDPADVRPQLYDYESIRRLLNIESYFSRICWKYVEQIWSRGWDIVSKTPTISAYIKKRLAQIAYVSDYTTHELLVDTAIQLVAYSNVYIKKIRKLESSGGAAYYIGGKKILPIAALVVLDTPSVRALRNEFGIPVVYQQRVREQTPSGYVDIYEDISPQDIIHITFHRDAGFSEGTPMVIPVIDDIAALRRLEETAEIIAFQASIPIYHFKAGTEKSPAGAPEVDDLESRVSEMLAHGALITNERMTAAVIQAEAEITSILEFIQYYKGRVLMGLGTSGVMVGESSTSNRDTSLVLTNEMHQVTRMMQRAIKEAFDHRIFTDLLLEGSVDIFDSRYTAQLYIPEIDVDAQRAHQDHGLLLYQGGAIGETELRGAYLGLDPIDDSQREDMYLERFIIPKIVATGQAAADAKIAGAEASAKKTQSQSRPTNQHGTKAAPAKKAKRDAMAAVEKEVRGTASAEDWMRIATDAFDLTDKAKVKLHIIFRDNEIILKNSVIPDLTELTYDEIISAISTIVPEESVK
jgi:hypothetical protein